MIIFISIYYFIIIPKQNMFYIVTGSLTWKSHVDVPLDSETHGGDDVAVFAWGPYHQIFTGLYEQNHIPHRMAYAGCFGPGLHACSAADHVAPLLLALISATLALLYL